MQIEEGERSPVTNGEGKVATKEIIIAMKAKEIVDLKDKTDKHTQVIQISIYYS